MFTSGLNDAKIIDYMKKCFKRKLSRIKFHTRKSVDAHLYPPPYMELRPQRYIGPRSTFFIKSSTLKGCSSVKKKFLKFFGFHRVKEQSKNTRNRKNKTPKLAFWTQSTFQQQWSQFYKIID